MPVNTGTSEYLAENRTFTEAMPFYNDNQNQNRTERLIAFILNESKGKVRDTVEISKIFLWHTIMFLPSIFLNVNGLKIKERLFA